METQLLHETIKAKLATRTNEELISDAKVARANKADETQRMIFALIMDVLLTVGKYKKLGMGSIPTLVQCCEIQSKGKRSVRFRLPNFLYLLLEDSKSA